MLDNFGHRNFMFLNFMKDLTNFTAGSANIPVGRPNFPEAGYLWFVWALFIHVHRPFVRIHSPFPKFQQQLDDA